MNHQRLWYSATMGVVESLARFCSEGDRNVKTSPPTVKASKAYIASSIATRAPLESEGLGIIQHSQWLGLIRRLKMTVEFANQCSPKISFLYFIEIRSMNVHTHHAIITILEPTVLILQKSTALRSNVHTL